MSKKLMNDPEIAELVQTREEKASSSASRELRKEFKRAISEFKALGKDHVADAKNAGNHDGATRLKSFVRDASVLLEAGVAA